MATEKKSKKRPIIRDDEARMTFTEHLAELRIRIIRSGIALIVGFVFCCMFSKALFESVAGPLRNVEGADWVTLTPIEGFLVRIRLAAYGGIVLAMPYIVYQACAFIFPGLKPGERKAVRILLTGSTFLVAVGVSVAYFGTLPLVLPYLLEMTPEGVKTFLSMRDTITLLIGFYLAFAVAFQFPMVVLILVYLDLLSPATLKAYRKPAIVALAALSALLTPPDPISMLLMAGPLVILYEASIWVSYLVARRRRHEADDPNVARPPRPSSDDEENKD